ncbi:MAG: response regulator transcription factor [Chloroflexi bacterium]|nr:LuxR C-terminal-related transcriptional regulator [Dehalococcoidia bacterium]NJD64198.1 response regulator transcription factor [Chloroflexota bacterium]PWB41349.1 MAG: hypothetical protein C3F10_15790 [Dehalococcoidia bacterium]
MAVNVFVMEAQTDLRYDNHAPREREGEEVRAMHQDLSPREREVVALVAHGKTNAQIALETGLSEATVKNYLANAMHKAGVDNRTALAVWWTSAGTSTNG